MALDPSFEEQQHVEAALERRGMPLRARERRAELLLGGGFVLACILLLLAAPPWQAALDPAAALCCALALAVAVSVHFVVGPGYTVPTQLAFIPLAFAVPPALLAPAAAAVFAAAQLVDVVRSQLPISRLALVPSNTWFALGPAAVLAATGAPPAAEATVPLVAGMVAAQVAIDATMSCIRDALHGELDPRAVLGEAWLYAVDVALTPIAFVVALALPAQPWAALAIVPLLGVLAVFARERDARMQGLAELNTAYRGTALVLGDVVEADDGYTGEHCRDVVELAVAVGRRHGTVGGPLATSSSRPYCTMSARSRSRRASSTSPAHSTRDEWEIVRQHTIQGQRMLDRVGGFMREVGTIVRSHHERWDGSGYPDGLAGDAIPLEARIIGCCDAWNAMTTTRSYREALSDDVAAHELRANSGTQFDPNIVVATLAVAQPERPLHELVTIPA